ncbi:MAG: sigma-54-dependent Fis family transcriptional regulator [Phycisphaerales bacterium]|nr:sigma-54-dependent Fis family transcriptional regulator [Phycisphaerales bacterium]
MARILICDDQEMMRDSLAATLAREEHDVVACGDPGVALQRVSSSRFDLLITDYRMPRMNGNELLAQVRKVRPDLPVVLMTAFGTVENAVAAMKGGAYDFIPKPFDGAQIKLVVDRAIEHGRLVNENQVLRSIVDQNAPRPLVGSGQSMEMIKAQITKVAASSATVLIRGESGTGKELVARAIHQFSPRAQKPFLAVNCAALSENLLESELFGHERGAFTGADRLRRGRFELADGGTLLLDEISEIAPSLQAKLLRVLQENQFERVGSSSTQSVDVRVVATTNRDLEQCVEEGKFRGDLFYRLNVVPIELPPLRQRSGDIPELCRHFLHQIARRTNTAYRHIEPEAIRLLQRYNWPGNVRELQNIIERAIVLETQPGVIRAQTIEPWLRVRPLPSSSDGDFSGRPLADMEKQVILTTLDQFHGHRIKTARALGIGVRTLGMKLKKWKEEGELIEA